MFIVKKIKKNCNNLNTITLISVFFVFFFSSCSFLKKISDEDKNELVVTWNDESNTEKKRPEKQIKRDNPKKEQSLLENIDPDSISGSGTDFFEEYSQVFGYSLTGEENPGLLEEIASWLGTRYKYGGTDLNGTDCSGFVGSVIYKVYGIKISRSSRDMINDVVRIPTEELKDGDIIFFKINGNNISHVGIYISNNKFAHSSIKRGVVINDLDERYYKERFYAAGRVKK